MNTILGRMSGTEGHTVNTDWFTYKVEKCWWLCELVIEQLHSVIVTCITESKGFFFNLELVIFN